jgi:DNA-directed RNA polymerase subunit RPC12/RpoP
MSVYACKSCGGEVVGDSTLAATSCPYCGNAIVMKGKFAGDLKPDLVIPFKKTQDDAKAAYLKHLEGKPLLPKVFKSQNRINEIKGMYVPVWLFDSDVDADINYNATKVRTWEDANYRYRETSYYKLIRSGFMGFNDIPVDGSAKMPDELMESIEPFDTKEAVDFQTAYLAGYLADRYDVTAKDSEARANERIKRSTENAFAKTVVSYDTHDIESESIRYKNSSYKYALYPVWILSTTWNSESFTFIMNAQTGKMAGNLPMDKGLFGKYFVGIAAIVIVIMLLIFYFVG